MEDPSAGAITRAFAYLGLVNHLDELIRGVIDLKDIVFYLSFIAFGLFLAHQSVESERWRA
jgi:ABC-2 type transport system permease protein